MIGAYIAVIFVAFLLFLVIVITMVIWALAGPVGVIFTYGLIVGIIMLIRSEKNERLKRRCDELGITKEEYKARKEQIRQQAAAAEWQSLSKGEKVSRRHKQRYWEIWGK